MSVLGMGYIYLLGKGANSVRGDRPAADPVRLTDANGSHLHYHDVRTLATRSTTFATFITTDNVHLNQSGKLG